MGTREKTKGKFMTEKIKVQKTNSADEAWRMCNIFTLLGPAQILFLIKSIIHFN